MKIVPTVGVFLHSPRARGAILTFLAPAKRLALGLSAGLVGWFVADGLQRAGYGRAVEVLGTVSLVAFLMYQLYQRVKEAQEASDDRRLNCPLCGCSMKPSAKYSSVITTPYTVVECPIHGQLYFGPNTDLTLGLPPQIA